METLEKIKDLISEGKLESAISSLRKFLTQDNSDYERELEQDLLKLSARFSIVKKEALESTLPQEYVGSEYAKITALLLRILHDVKTDDVSGSSSPSQSRLNPPIIRFHNAKQPESYSFEQNYSLVYQFFNIGVRPNSADRLNDFIYNRLKDRQDSNDGLWKDDERGVFGMLHTNTSVLYYLIQKGISIRDSMIKEPLAFLDSVQDMNIDNRAKYYFDIQMHRIDDRTCYDFIRLLRSFQYQEGHRFAGAFKPFLQGGSISEDSPNKQITHYGGVSFHALLISDVLLHISAEQKYAREEAVKALRLSREFFICILQENNGYLVDGSYDKSPQFTTWMYVLSRSLGIDLPENWEGNIKAIINIEIDSMFKRALLNMNLALILHRYGDIISNNLREALISYFEEYFRELELFLSKAANVSKSSSIHLSLYGRSLLYINMCLGNKIS